MRGELDLIILLIKKDLNTNEIIKETQEPSDYKKISSLGKESLTQLSEISDNPEKLKLFEKIVKKNLNFDWNNLS